MQHVLKYRSTSYHRPDALVDYSFIGWFENKEKHPKWSREHPSHFVADRSESTSNKRLAKAEAVKVQISQYSVRYRRCQNEKVLEYCRGSISYSM
jgi:hypothetical protein